MTSYPLPGQAVRATWLRYALSTCRALACMLWAVLAMPGAHAQGSSAMPESSLGTIASEVSTGAGHSCVVAASGAVQC